MTTPTDLHRQAVAALRAVEADGPSYARYADALANGTCDLWTLIGFLARPKTYSLAGEREALGAVMKLYLTEHGDAPSTHPATVDERRERCANLIAKLPAPMAYDPGIMGRRAAAVRMAGHPEYPVSSVLAMARLVLRDLALEPEHAAAAREALDALAALWAVI